ncbi:hypothetical protein [Lignipirellula cremea]|uniref:Uncharacterized protein n=1 Tax=Lignipirellula cremea TaxID=2528010 RepID=A0A518DUG4_9BACT|nr:hypothetical protein [Lignipirellula cremea]QDU95483.1 hypothetical protein Pla8534_32980 [Lignipirellula cremea]
MIGKLLRSTGAIVAALVLALAGVIAVEGFSAVVHPFPPGVDATDLEACIAHVARYPHWVLGVVVGLWGGIVLGSVWLATRLGTGRHPAHGVAIGVLLCMAVAFNCWMLPYPLWFELALLLTLPVCVVLGSLWGTGGPSDPHPHKPQQLTPLDGASG